MYSNNKYQQFLEIQGPGGTGKSTLVELIVLKLGHQNVHITNLAVLENSKFETANLLNKKLVVINDSVQYAGSISVLKALIGQDMLNMERKHENAASPFQPYCLLIIVSNEFLSLRDHTTGLKRRRIPFIISSKERVDTGDLSLIDYLRSEIPEFTSYILK